MAKVVFENGQTVEFEGTPSPQDIEEVASQLKFNTSLTPGTGTQTAGPIVSPTGLFQKLKPRKEEIPELIGSMTGGFARRTLPGMALAAFGSATGEAGRQIGERVGIFKTPPPETSTEAAKRIGAAGLRGAFGETVGRGVGKLFTPFSGGVTPEISKQVQAAGRAGVKPPLSAVTESKPVQALERFTEFGPFGSAVTRQKQEAVKQLGDFAEKISDGISSDNPPEFIGELAARKVKDFEKAFRTAKDKLYEPINNVLNEKPVDPKNTIAAIKTVLERKEGGAEGRALLEDWLKRLEPSGMEAAGYSKRSLPNFNRLKAIRTEIGSRGNFNDPGVTGIKAQLETIYAAASKDMDDLANKYGMADYLKEVNAQYSKGIRKLQDSLIKAIDKKAEKSPESLHRLIIRQNSPSLIKAAKEIVGEDGFNQIRKQWFDDLVNRSKSIVDGEEIVSPAKLANNLRKMGSSLDEITAGNPELAAKLSDLSDTAKLLTRGQKVTAGSQTGFILSTLKDIRGILSAPLVRTETGREFLTTGYPKVGKFAERAAQAGGQLGLQKASE